MTHAQLPLSDLLPPLKLRDVVLVCAEGWISEVAQVWPGRDHYAVFAWGWHGSIDAGLSVYRRDELELRPDVPRSEVWKR